MAEWKYELPTEGKLLRELIEAEGEDENEQAAKVIDQLRRCCKILLGQLDADDEEYHRGEIEELYNLIDGEADALRNNPDEISGWGFESSEELIDSRLAGFYDICDGCRCWVG